MAGIQGTVKQHRCLDMYKTYPMKLKNTEHSTHIAVTGSEQEYTPKYRIPIYLFLFFVNLIQVFYFLCCDTFTSPHCFNQLPVMCEAKRSV